MAMIVSDILTRASDTLLDAGLVRWTKPELLRYLNDGRKAIALARPDLFSVMETVALDAGTMQEIPTAGIRFMDAIRNVKADNSMGAAVRVIEKEALDFQNPNWHAAKPAASMVHFAYDERTPRRFYVYPPAIAGTKLEITYSYNPSPLTLDADTLSEEGALAIYLTDYVLYRAFLKDTEYGGNGERASFHLKSFMSGIGSELQVGTVVSPNSSDIGGVPPRKG